MAKFKREIGMMMYGYGDVPNPNEEAVEMMEHIMLEYLGSVIDKALLLRGNIWADIQSNIDKNQTKKTYRNQRKLKTADIMYAVSSDKLKYSRVEELLFMNDELREARKAFNEEEISKD